MNVTTETHKDDALYVEVQGSQMHSIARSVFSLKKIETDAQKLSIWVVPRRIYSMKERNMGSRSGEEGPPKTFFK